MATKHAEKDVLLLDVHPEEDITERELTEAIQELKVPNLKWMDKFEKEEIAFGIYKLRVGAMITDGAVDTDALLDAITALHSKVEHHHHKAEKGHHGEHERGATGAAAKKLVKSVDFVVMSKFSS